MTPTVRVICLVQPRGTADRLSGRSRILARSPSHYEPPSMTEPVPALLTDLYQLTMAQAYFDEGLRENAVFELFVRTLPPTRRVLIAAGLEQVVEYLEGLRFDSDDIEHLRTLGSFSAPFLAELS